MSRLDYSKWDHIEISDDEDDTHPNIDTPSLFRWRHQARVEKMEEQKREKEQFVKGKTEHQQRMSEIRQRIKESEEKSLNDGMESLKLELAELEKQEEEYKRKEAELSKKEKLTPWNVDTICHESKSKTIINKYTKVETKQLTEDELFEKQKAFTDENENLMKKFGMLRRYEDSQEFLLEHPQLAAEETANYLVIWCINLQVEEKKELMAHVAHQTIVMQFILELARTLKTHPRDCIRPFFSRIALAEKQYLDAFNDELESFKERVRGRAQARIDKALEELEEEERQKRLGPGGLDPVEVFESLPQELQDCFEKKDIPMLEKALLAMPKEEADKHLKRCIDSGLWVPGKNDDTKPVASST